MRKINKKQLRAMFAQKHKISKPYIHLNAKVADIDHIGKGIDYGITKHIRRLNELGYKTKYSHSGLRSDHPGYKPLESIIKKQRMSIPDRIRTARRMGTPSPGSPYLLILKNKIDPQKLQKRVKPWKVKEDEFKRVKRIRVGISKSLIIGHYPSDKQLRKSWGTLVKRMQKHRPEFIESSQLNRIKRTNR